MRKSIEIMHLHECRQLLGIGKVSMGLLLGVSRATYYRYEAGNAPAAALWLARALAMKRPMTGPALARALREEGSPLILERFLRAPNHPTQAGSIEPVPGEA